MTASARARAKAAVLLLTLPSILCPTSCSSEQTAWERGLSWYVRNTGVEYGTPLRPSGPITITADGTTVEGLDVDGAVTIKARDVTIRNSRVRGTIVNSLGQADQNVLLEHVEIDLSDIPLGEAQKYAVLADYGVTLRNVKAHGMSQGIALSGRTQVYDSYFFGLRSNAQHSEAIISGGATSASGGHVVIARNWLDADEADARGFVSGALCLYGDYGQIRDITISGNHLTGAGYLLYAGAGASKPYPMPSNVVVTDNTFDPRGWGPVYPAALDEPSTKRWFNNLLVDGTVVPAPTGTN